MFILNNQVFSAEANELPEFISSVTNYQYGKKFVLHHSFGNGDFRLVALPGGLRAFVSNYIVLDDFDWQLLLPGESGLALHLNQVQAGPAFSIELNDESVAYDDGVVNAVFATSGSEKLVVKGSSGAVVNRLKILLTEEWIQNNAGSFDDDLLQQYLQLGTQRLHMESMDSEYRKLVDLVMNTEDNADYVARAHEIISRIIQRFFNRLPDIMKDYQKNERMNGQVA